MKVHLLHPEQDFDRQAPLPAQAERVAQDLEIDTLCTAMAAGDDFLYQVARQHLLAASEIDERVVRYRQHVLRDCLAQPDTIRELYATVLEVLDSERQSMRMWALGRSPSSLLHRGIELLSMLIARLETIKVFSLNKAQAFESEGLVKLFSMLDSDLDEDYLATVKSHIEALRFKHGVLIGARLGRGNQGEAYELKAPHEEPGWLQHLLPATHGEEYSFRIADRDEAGHTALAELRERGIATVADSLAQAGDHVLGFFVQLRDELAVYMGAMNLHAALCAVGGTWCFPEPTPAAQRRYAATALYDPCLTLNTSQPAVASDLSGDDKALLLVTGANRGGKSTFLRALGVAQLMMQAGLFVAAECFSANLASKLFTHFKQEEDAEMDSGKFDEELLRMSTIVDALAPDSLLLLNESFAATNEKEGSEIARQVCSALLERRIKLVYVTHLYSFAHNLYESHRPDVLFLRAERLDDGKRSFRVLPATPLETSFGKDLYERIFLENAANNTQSVDNSSELT